MDKITDIRAIEILDSRGVPSLRVFVEVEKHIVAKASVPSGMSTGTKEVLELRDKDPRRYFGKGTLTAKKHVEGPIKTALLGKSVLQQKEIDQIMIKLDGTPMKEKLGANAILGVSMAVAKAGAKVKNLPLYRYLSNEKIYTLPCPMMNIINGGAHADNLLDFQEFMIRPKGFSSFKEALRAGAEIFHCLKKQLKKKGLSTNVGDEGGFAPGIHTPEDTLGCIVEAVKEAGYKPGEQIRLALDAAANEFYENGMYIEKKKKVRNQSYTKKSAQEMCAYFRELMDAFPIDSIEDGFAEDDWKGWKYASKELGSKLQLVGDDIFVTNAKIVKKGIEDKVANAVLIKLNQVGTVSETLDTILLAKKHNYQTVISHRSGETSDTFIADFAVATNAGQIKTGSLSRGERTAKYNRLLEIEEELQKEGSYQDSNPF